MTKYIVVVFAILLGGPLLFGQDPGDVKPQASGSVEETAGKAVYQQTCGFCHGPDGRGASGADLLHSTLVSHDVGGNLIGEVMHKGRPDKGIPHSLSRIRRFSRSPHSCMRRPSSRPV